MNCDAPESELWQRFRGGDRAAFEAIVRAHQACLRKFAAAMLRDGAEGDDVAQRAFLDVWHERERLAAVSSPRAHLLARVRHLCWTRSRSRRRQKWWIGRAAEEPVDTPSTPLDHLVDRASALDDATLVVRLAALVDDLDDDSRTVIWMRFAGEASFDEIGAAVGRPPHAVRALAYRQLALLKKRLSEIRR